MNITVASGRGGGRFGIEFVSKMLCYFRVKVFEEKLNGYSKEVEAFRKKEVYLLEHIDPV